MDDMDAELDDMLEAVIEPKRNAPFGIFCLH